MGIILVSYVCTRLVREVTVLRYDKIRYVATYHSPQTTGCKYDIPGTVYDTYDTQYGKHEYIWHS